MKQLYIADDNSDFALFLKTVAERDGWSVVVCANGRELLDQVQLAQGAALLLVDINMPELDGIQAVEGLAGVDRPLRIRFMTGGADTSIMAAKMIARARSLSVGRNIFKPVTKDRLLSILADEATLLADG
ncbi:response regulator [Aliiroseovarius crassostreae]|uniref:Response regulator n=1 Tax=Aliiroseovarius crassostreae TaxID=154981 RepID=A0A9Q9HBA5_9RHOB|nr:response regulator [Aliiroseovarius crassostreae]UWP94691.1 response regulator [Aliiroseovarius crassostreae]